MNAARSLQYILGSPPYWIFPIFFVSIFPFFLGLVCRSNAHFFSLILFISHFALPLSAALYIFCIICVETVNLMIFKYLSSVCQPVYVQDYELSCRF